MFTVRAFGRVVSERCRWAISQSRRPPLLTLIAGLAPPAPFAYFAHFAHFAHFACPADLFHLRQLHLGLLRLLLLLLRFGLGLFGLIFDGTWLHKFDRTLADGTLVHGKGTFDLAINTGGIGGVYPSYKFNAGATWGKGPLGAGISTRFIGSYKECADITGASSSAGACYQFPSPSHHVSAYNEWDAFVSYVLSSRAGKTSLAVGAHNLFDTAPPVVYNSFTPTSDPTAYDFLGAFYYVRLTHTT